MHATTAVIGEWRETLLGYEHRKMCNAMLIVL
uniref:Uncharacterized protein n=1 Tax=Arundo donax TaxID=35708 RepID=A0A0A9AIF7_ARUDO